MAIKENKVTVRLDDESKQKLDSLADQLGLSRSRVIRDYIMNGQVVLSDQKMIVQQIAMTQENFNNKALSLMAGISKLTEVSNAMKNAYIECGFKEESYESIKKYEQEHKKIIENSMECFRIIRQQGEREVEHIVNTEIGKR